MNQRQKAIDNYYKNPNTCKLCGKIIEITEGSRVTDIRKKKFCNKSCATKFYQLNNKKNKFKTCEICGKRFSDSRSKYCEECRTNPKFYKLQNLSKGDLISQKGYFKARSSICKNARTIFYKNFKQPKCIICGYDKYIEICHIKAVKDFSDTDKIYDINNINNLVALCPNHHKEFDNGLIDLTKYIK